MRRNEGQRGGAQRRNSNPSAPAGGDRAWVEGLPRNAGEGKTALNKLSTEGENLSCSQSARIQRFSRSVNSFLSAILPSPAFREKSWTHTRSPPAGAEGSPLHHRAPPRLPSFPSHAAPWQRRHSMVQHENK